MSDTKTNKVIVNVVLDRSGSMNSTRESTIEGYNEYIQGLRADKDSEYWVTLTQFDAPMTVPELTITYADRALADVPALSAAEYQPRGNTPLYDAIGECVRRVDAKDRAVIVLIITDGMENASTEFTKDSVKALIKQKELKGWTFAFLGANIDSYAVGGSVGVAAMNIANYAQGNESLLYRNLAQSTMARAAAYRSVGVKAAVSMEFFDDNQRKQMGSLPNHPLGGQPAAPRRFRSRIPKRRRWTVNSSPLPRS